MTTGDVSGSAGEAVPGGRRNFASYRRTSEVDGARVRGCSGYFAGAPATSRVLRLLRACYGYFARRAGRAELVDDARRPRSIPGRFVTSTRASRRGQQRPGYDRAPRAAV